MCRPGLFLAAFRVIGQVELLHRFQFTWGRALRERGRPLTVLERTGSRSAPPPVSLVCKYVCMYVSRPLRRTGFARDAFGAKHRRLLCSRVRSTFITGKLYIYLRLARVTRVTRGIWAYSRFRCLFGMAIYLPEPETTQRKIAAFLRANCQRSSSVHFYPPRKMIAAVT